MTWDIVYRCVKSADGLTSSMHLSTAVVRRVRFVLRYICRVMLRRCGRRVNLYSLRAGKVGLVAFSCHLRFVMYAID